MSLRSSELFIYYIKQNAVLVTLIQTVWGSATKREHIAPEAAQGFDICTWHMPMADLGFSVPATGYQAPYVTESQMTFGGHIMAIASLLPG